MFGLYANNSVWGKTGLNSLLIDTYKNNLCLSTSRILKHLRIKTDNEDGFWGLHLFPFLLKIWITAVLNSNTEKLWHLSFPPFLFPLQVELTGSSVFDYVHPGDHVEMAEQLGMKLPPGRGLLSQGTAEDGASSASSSSQSETPEPGGNCKPIVWDGGQDLCQWLHSSCPCEETINRSKGI